MSDDGLITLASNHPVKATMDRLEAALRDKGITLFARIDHAAGAASVDMPLRPTELIIFGNPKSGTPLMLAAPSSALDLPLKILVREDVREDAGRKVWISYNSPAYLVRRHGLPPELISNIAAIEGLAAQAAA